MPWPVLAEMVISGKWVPVVGCLGLLGVRSDLLWTMMTVLSPGIVCDDISPGMGWDDISLGMGCAEISLGMGWDDTVVVGVFSCGGRFRRLF